MSKTFQFVKDVFSEKVKGVVEMSRTDMPDDAYHSLSKPQIFQEAKCFHDKQLNDKKCRIILTKLIYLINQGQELTEQESIEIFFAITKLFQSQNFELRRMIYLTIRELPHQENAAYIITSSLTKDINSKSDLVRINALRVMPLIVEPQYLVQSERYVKNAINDKNTAVSCAALISGIHLYSNNSDLVRRWTTEIAEKLNSKVYQTHHHALILLHEIKKQDKLAFIKTLVNLAKDSQFSNYLAIMQAIRFIREVMLTTELDQPTEKIFIDYLGKQIHKSNEIIVFEAVRTLCEIKNITNKELSQTVAILSVFLTSSSSISRFAALRIINKLIQNPIRQSLISNTQEIENILSDNNKSISSLAISILLKVCKEENIEKLLNQIFEYINEISDEFKIDIIKSVKTLIRKAPKKFRILLQFLSNGLKQEGSQEFKKSCIDAIEFIIKEIPEAKESGLLHLVEFIEDCQYSGLHIQVLNLLKKESINTQYSSKFVRFINNRINLEEAEIRAAAIGTIGKLGINNEEVRESIRGILENNLDDNEDEVKERAFFYLDFIKRLDNKVENGQETKDQYFNLPSIDEVDDIERYVQENMNIIKESRDYSCLDHNKINQYIKENIQISPQRLKDKRIVDDYVPQEEYEQQQQQSNNRVNNYQQQQQILSLKPSFPDHEIFNMIGDVKVQTQAKELTDIKSEYHVVLTKYFFEPCIILEFKVTNTLNNVILKEVSTELQLVNDNLRITHIFSANEIKFNQTESIFVIVARNPEQKIITATASCFLKFVVTEVTPGTFDEITSYDDEYQIEDLELLVSDYLVPQGLPNLTFTTTYDALSGSEISQTYQLPYKTVELAVKGLIKHFGLAVCDSTDQINVNNKFHSLYLSGAYLRLEEILVVCMVGMDANLGCVVKIRAKSNDPVLATNLVESVS